MQTLRRLSREPSSSDDSHTIASDLSTYPGWRWGVRLPASARRGQDSSLDLLDWMSDIERDHHSFAVSERQSTSPHCRRKDYEQPRLWHNPVQWWQVEAELGWRSAKFELAFGTSQGLRYCHIERRTEPALRMMMPGVMAAFAEAHRPAVGKARRFIPPRCQLRMVRIGLSQLRNVRSDCIAQRAANPDDFGLYAGEQRPVGLRT